MTNVNTLLSQRLKKSDQQTSKMAEMAKQSANGNLSSFNGIFSVSELNDKEKQEIEQILAHYSLGIEINKNDLNALLAITSEVKAINNQAAILHGERIKKAQTILKKYRDGAFTSWLIATYGNRQTPYNLLQYYEFYEALPKNLRVQLESMPRQAIYTLASREGPFEKKQEVVENYQGQTKAELLEQIRFNFPLAVKDKRNPNAFQNLLAGLEKLHATLRNQCAKLTGSQKIELLQAIDNLRNLVETAK